ncbi:electron carrier [Spatholobus suberectus]|nr:electron carrier [Spatholobus suberectus]
MANNSINSNDANTTSSRFSLFNRSLSTVHKEKQPQKPPQLERSLTKFVESARGGGVVKRLCNFFESAKSSSSEERRLKPSKSIENLDSSTKSLDSSRIARSSSTVIRLPGTEDRIVLYFTSLRGIRRTYEDCYAVRMIFRGFRVWVDERDISMDANYKKELMSLFGENKRKGLRGASSGFYKGEARGRRGRHQAHVRGGGAGEGSGRVAADEGRVRVRELRGCEVHAVWELQWE